MIIISKKKQQQQVGDTTSRMEGSLPK